MGKEQLWSMSTTIREAERIVGFLKTAIEIEGHEWTKDKQDEFQIRLIKNRFYLDPNKTQSYGKLNTVQHEILRNNTIPMTYEQAKGIFIAKEYKDSPMRGRVSMSLIVKL